jgi:hypothetical protein
VQELPHLRAIINRKSATLNSNGAVLAQHAVDQRDGQSDHIEVAAFQPTNPA